MEPRLDSTKRDVKREPLTSATRGQGAGLFATRRYRCRTLTGAVELANARRERAGLPGLPEGLTPHSLRRTFISLLLAIGDEVPYVMQQVGHATPQVTLGIYAKVMFRRDGERERLRRLVGRGTQFPAEESVEGKKKWRSPNVES